jgi:hypothetical protein
MLLVIVFEVLGEFEFILVDSTAGFVVHSVASQVLVTAAVGGDLPASGSGDSQGIRLLVEVAGGHVDTNIAGCIIAKPIGNNGVDVGDLGHTAIVFLADRDRGRSGAKHEVLVGSGNHYVIGLLVHGAGRKVGADIAIVSVKRIGDVGGVLRALIGHGIVVANVLVALDRGGGIASAAIEQGVVVAVAVTLFAGLGRDCHCRSNGKHQRFQSH